MKNRKTWNKTFALALCLGAWAASSNAKVRARTRSAARESWTLGSAGNRCSCDQIKNLYFFSYNFWLIIMMMIVHICTSYIMYAKSTRPMIDDFQLLFWFSVLHFLFFRFGGFKCYHYHYPRATKTTKCLFQRPPSNRTNSHTGPHMNLGESKIHFIRFDSQNSIS